MSTFINDGDKDYILVKCAQRYLLFDSFEGGFLDEIEFEDLREEKEADLRILEQKKLL